MNKRLQQRLFALSVLLECSLLTSSGISSMQNDNRLYEPRYVLAVNSISKSKKYYVEKMGFDILNEYPGWLFLKRDNVTLMLGECVNEKPASEIGDHSYFAYIEVKEADTLYEEFKQKGIEIMKQLKDEPWGMREFGIKTIEGHRMMFGEDLDA